MYIYIHVYICMDKYQMYIYIHLTNFSKRVNGCRFCYGLCNKQTVI